MTAAGCGSSSDGGECRCQGNCCSLDAACRSSGGGGGGADGDGGAR